MPDYPTAASDLFHEVLVTGGCNQNQCPHCGRCLIATRSYPEDELETLRCQADQSNDRIVLIDADCLYVGTMPDGNYFLFDCPCHHAGRVEAFIVANHLAILRYLTALSKKEREALDTADTYLQNLG